MKLIFKRLICVCMVVLLCFSSISILNAFAEDEPALSKKCETVIDEAGNNTDFGTAKNSYLRTSSVVKLPASIDLTNADVFEADIYIEDIDALKTVMPDITNISFCFSSQSNKTKQQYNHADAVISSQLTKSGWNHIELKKSDFVESNIKWDKTWLYYVRFSDESFNSGNVVEALKGNEVKIRNVCESYDVPVITETCTLLPDATVFSTLGETAESKLSGIGNTYKSNFDATDLSSATFIKADLLIPSFAEFTAFVENKNFKFVLSSDNGTAEYVFAGAYFPSTLSGWYTVLLPAGNFKKNGSFDFAAVTGFRIEITDDTDSELGEAYALKLGYANIRGLEFQYPEGDIFLGETTVDCGVSHKIVEFGNTFGDLNYSKSSDFNALSDAENVEFYLYIDNLDSFNNFFKFDRSSNPVDASFDLTLSKGSAKLVWTGIEKSVVTSGWNHIILPVSSAQNSGFDPNKKFDKAEFNVSGVDKTALSNNYGSFLIIDKLVATKGYAAKGELEFKKTQDFSSGKAYKLGESFAALSEKVSAPVDFTGTKFVEFDVFIQNTEAFKTLMGEKGVTGISLCLSSTDDDDYTKNSLTAKISTEITKNGWNHAVVPFNSFKNGTKIGTFDESAVTAWSLLFNSTSVAETGSLKGQAVAVKNIALTEAVNPEMPAAASPAVSEAGRSGIYGDKYSDTLGNSRIILDSPVDITLYAKLQFDFYVEDYDAFKKMLEGTSNKLRFGLGTSEDASKNLALYDFTSQVTGRGWNRIVLTNTNNTAQNGAPNLKTVYNAFLTFGSESSTNPYGYLSFDFKNICSVPHERDIVPEPPEYVVDIWKDGKMAKWGDTYVNTKITFRKDYRNEPLDISDADLIEFDIYIEDYEAFMAMPYASSVRFVLSSSDTNDYNQKIATYKIDDQITHDGWNHIVVNKTSYDLDWGKNFEHITWAFLTVWTSMADQNNKNPIGSTILRIANIVGTHAEYRKVPALPDQVVSVLGDENGVYFAGNTVGKVYHWTLDRIYKQRFEPIDFSKTNKIEFDVYVDDYEKFLAAENYEGDPRNSKLSFELSATPPALWDQYSAPRHYFSSAVYLAEHIKHSGWNHVVVGKQEFTAVNNGGVNWSAITAFLVFYRGSSNYDPYNNPYSDLYVKVGNICNTGLYVEVPKDGEKAERGDKSAVYINTAEGLTDENGAWNLMDGGVNTDYKTEGKSSLLQKINYTHTIDNTRMMYIFDETVDMSDLKTLKFDFFVDIPSNIQRPGNTVQIALANDRFVRDNYCYWNLDLSKLKSGWNSIELPMSKAKHQGKVDVAGVKTFTLRFTELDLDKENFAVVLYGIDNLRYISSTGSTTLNINLPDEDDDLIDDDFDDFDDFDDDFDDDFTDDIEEPSETDVEVQGETIYRKTVERIKVIDYTMIIIALAAEAAAIIIGLVIFTIIYEKKHKKKI